MSSSLAKLVHLCHAADYSAHLLSATECLIEFARTSKLGSTDVLDTRDLPCSHWAKVDGICIPAIKTRHLQFDIPFLEHVWLLAKC